MKRTKLILSLFALTVMLITVSFVSATHTSSVSVSPSGWLKSSTSYNFNFTVTNNGPDAISTVIITRPNSGFSNIAECSNVTGWINTKTNTYCRWEATASQKINSGASKIFGLTLTTGTYGSYNWSVETLDSFSFLYEKFVPIEIQTIQNAINTASPGATIVVPAGVYEEDILITTNNIELIGANKETTIIKGKTTELNSNFPNAGTKGNSIATIEINANGIKIHGFTIETPDLDADHYTFSILLDGSNIEIYDNIFNLKSDGGAVVNPVDGNGSVVIQTWTAVNGGTNIKGLNIHNNVFKEDDTKKLRKNGYYGIYLNLPSDGDASVNRISIKDNTFSGRIWRAITTEHSYVDIESNTITTTNDDSWNYGKAISVLQWASNAIQSVKINDTSISGSTSSDAFLWGVTIGTGGTTDLFSSINIVDNTIKDSDIGVNVYNDTDKINVNRNILIDNNVKALSSADTVRTLDAENNFWGVTTYDEILALVSENVDFDPWWYDAQGSNDTTKPIITFHNAPYFSGSTTVTINATITDDRDVERYILNFGDGNITNVNITGDHNLTVNVVVDHTYANGDYVVSLTAYDRTGNYDTKTTSVSIDNISYDWRIPLTTGWNLISFPMIPTDEDGNINKSVLNVFDSVLGSMPGGTDYVIFQYDAYNGIWRKARKTGYSPSSAYLGEIVPGYAYWVKVNQDTVLKGYGVKTDEWQMPPSVELGKSWNLIGKYGKTNVAKQNETDNLVYEFGLMSLADYPIMYNGNFLDNDDTLDYFEGYWTLLSGNWGGSIVYTVSKADYEEI